MDYFSALQGLNPDLDRYIRNGGSFVSAPQPAPSGPYPGYANVLSGYGMTVPQQLQPTRDFSQYMISSQADYGKNTAEYLARDLLRAQRRYYEDVYRPREIQLFEDLLVNYDKNVAEDIGRTKEAVSGAFAAETGASARRAGRYGLASRPQDLGLQETSAMVGGINRTRLTAEDRRMALLGGGFEAFNASQGGD